LKDSIFAKEEPTIMRSANTLYTAFQAQIIEGVISNKAVQNLFNTNLQCKEAAEFEKYSIEQWH
jgi:hypothetical protein